MNQMNQCRNAKQSQHYLERKDEASGLDTDERQIGDEIVFGFAHALHAIDAVERLDDFQLKKSKNDEPKPTERMQNFWVMSIEMMYLIRVGVDIVHLTRAALDELVLLLI
jgi:hypothetical protein